jgi:hypothetical protein
MLRSACVVLGFAILSPALAVGAPPAGEPVRGQLKNATGGLTAKGVRLFDVKRTEDGPMLDFVAGEKHFAVLVPNTGAPILAVHGPRPEAEEGEYVINTSGLPSGMRLTLGSIGGMQRLTREEAAGFAEVVREYTKQNSGGETALYKKVYPDTASLYKGFASALESFSAK